MERPRKSSNMLSHFRKVWLVHATCSCGLVSGLHHCCPSESAVPRAGQFFCPAMACRRLKVRNLKGEEKIGKTNVEDLVKLGEPLVSVFSLSSLLFSSLLFFFFLFSSCLVSSLLFSSIFFVLFSFLVFSSLLFSSLFFSSLVFFSSLLPELKFQHQNRFRLQETQRTEKKASRRAPARDPAPARAPARTRPRTYAPPHAHAPARTRPRTHAPRHRRAPARARPCTHAPPHACAPALTI